MTAISCMRRRVNSLYFVYIIIIVLFVIIIFHWLATSPHYYHHQQKPPQVKAFNAELDVSLSGKISMSSTLSSLPCDKECLRFKRLLEAWPADKPKAAVVLLLQPSSVNKFAQSSHLFCANFNDAYNYPVIVFHEENMNNKAHQQRLRSLTNSGLYFQVRSISSC